MFDALKSEVALDDLGDKVVRGISGSVVSTRRDLAEYRERYPTWVRAHSKRGLANWIHDRLWAYLSATLDGVDDVTIVDKEPKREFWVGVNYRLRVKRHHLDGAVSTYPTQTALQFLGQGGTPAFPSLEEIHLIAGYEWDDELRVIGAPQLSLRNGQDNIVWQVTLPEHGEEGDGAVHRPIRPEPTDPIADLPGVTIRRDGSEDDSE